MIAAIHQPNFFPWLGYFRKIALADVFVFLDAVQFPRTAAGNWINRVRLLVGGGPRWVTCPVERSDRSCPVREAVIFDKEPWRRKLLRTLELNYAKATFFRKTMGFVEPLILKSTQNLAEYNVENIKAVSRVLGLECGFVSHFDLQGEGVHDARGSERLAAICLALGAETYLAGDGADMYEDEGAYASKGVALVESRFVVRPYPQVNAETFVPGLSVLDALMNVGPEGTRALLFDDGG